MINPDLPSCPQCGAPLEWALRKITDARGRRREENDFMEATCTGTLEQEDGSKVPCGASFTQFVNR